MDRIAVDRLVGQARDLTTSEGEEALFAFPVAAVIGDTSGDNSVVLGADGEICILTLTADRITLFGVEATGTHPALRRKASFAFDQMTPKGLAEEQPGGPPAILGFYWRDRRVTIQNIHRAPDFNTMAAFSIVQSEGLAQSRDSVDAASAPAAATAAPGWYQDPQGISEWRYWDGQVWTDHRA